MGWFPSEVEEAEEGDVVWAQSRIKIWVQGFGENKEGGKPYILTDYYRQLIFPESSPTKAVPKEEGDKTLETVSALDPEGSEAAD